MKCDRCFGLGMDIKKRVNRGRERVICSKCDGSGEIAYSTPEDIFDLTPPKRISFEEMLHGAEQIGVLTGSRAFGTEREDSDYDFMYSVKNQPELDKLIDGFARTESTYFKGFKIAVSGQVFNFIPLHPAEFMPWALATEALSASLRQSGITERAKIHGLFMGMVSMFKIALNISYRE